MREQLRSKDTQIQFIRDKIFEYEAEPVCLARVFVRSKKIKHHQGGSGAGDIVFRARNEGYDAFWGHNAVGGGKADEIIVFSSDDIMIASKESLVYEYTKKYV